MWRAATAIVLTLIGAVAAIAQYRETVTVVRYIVPLRVTDAAGAAITDLTAPDFSVELSGKPAIVEAAEWIGATPAPDMPVATPAGRLIVFFVGTDHAHNPQRMAGQLRFNILADAILKDVSPKDRVAVVSHDSHLKLRTDFTTDLATVRKAIADSIGSARVPLPPAQHDGPSLAAHLDEREMLHASQSESALLLVARALNALEGEKVLILAAFGMGLREGNLRTQRHDWGEAVGLLNAMHVPVIALNTGVGGRLSASMVRTARSTAGMYAFAGARADFPAQIVGRVLGMLAGRYEVTIRMREVLPPGEHKIAIRVGRRDARVLAPSLLTVPAAEESEEPEIQTNDLGAAEERFVQAMRRLQNDETEGVEALLDEAIALHPALADAWYERAMLAMARGDTAAASRDLARYLELAPRGRHAIDARAMLKTLQ